MNKEQLILKEFVSYLFEEPPKAPPSKVGAGGAQQILQQNAEALKTKKGIDISQLKQVGIGTRGVAYSFGDKVLKITADAQEAKASMRLVGKNLPNIVTIYDVWEFPNSKTYAVLQEPLQELADAEKKQINNALVITALPVWIAKGGYDWTTAKTKTIEYIKGEIAKKGLQGSAATDYMKKANDAWNFLSKTLDIKSMLETLKGMGINFHDFHAGNMMRRNDGKIVLIDIGMSKLSGGGTPAILEYLMRTRK